MHRDEFLELVKQAIDRLPSTIRKRLSNVEVVVEDYPGPDICHEMGLQPGNLLGLYQGVPLNKRGIHYAMVLPDKITLFQKPIESVCRNREEIIWQIKNTLIHEIGHHFGLSEAHIRRLTKGE